jgi:hypothetical protein
VTKKGDLSKRNWGFSNTTWGSTNKDVNMIVLRRSMGVSPVNTFFSMKMVVEPRKIGI